MHFGHISVNAAVNGTLFGTLIVTIASQTSQRLLIWSGSLNLVSVWEPDRQHCFVNVPKTGSLGVDDAIWPLFGTLIVSIAS